MKYGVLYKFRDDDGKINYDKFIQENSNIEKVAEDRGTAKRKKEWLLFEDGSIMVRDENLDSEGVLYTAYQELIFEELAKQVDFPCAHYDIGKREGKDCIFVENILNDRKDLAMISLKDLMDQVETKDDYSHTYNITDAFKAIGNHCRCVDLGKDVNEEVLKDFCKMQVLDTFLSSTDRHPENISFIVGADKKTGKKVFGLSPLYDNELSCGSEEPILKRDECLEDFTKARLIAAMQSPCATVDDEDMPDGGSSKKIKDSSTSLLQFCLDLDDEIAEFAEDCREKLNIPLAVKEVEKRTGLKVPKEFTEFLIGNYMYRKPMMSKAIDEYYDKMY